ncbi:dihydroorotase [Anaerotruncus rubiinfantis]|jgi:allantoinase|uniref:dihydroorotase n=1 Tax=Anaerotruncus rubiinfantis TaxID=1720200 RepID=UPI001898998C|nr:amidohydrolase family protein [Anaerotruncus rubiinfantis]
MFDAVFQNACVVLPDAADPADVAVQDGKIAAILPAGSGAAAQKSYELRGKILFPGVIDSHAHVTYCGDIASGSYTAASGGVTTLIEMPTSGWMPYVMDAGVFSKRVAEINSTSAVDFALWGGISPQAPEKAQELIACGAAAFKVFLSDAGDYRFFTDEDLLKLFAQVKESGTLVGVHAETECICAARTAALRAAGCGPQAHSDSRPVVSEVLAVSRLCAAALHEGVRVHVCHISAPEVVETVEMFRRRGGRIFAETCPHYLLLTDEDVIRCGAYAKCAPPIRSHALVEGLWEKVLSGEIDIIGSDHAAYPETQKEKGFWQAPGGFPGLDLILPGLYSEGVRKRGMSLCRLAEITSANAAKAFQLDSRKGSIKVGLDADFAVLDPNAEWEFSAADTFYNNKSAKYPYEGKRLIGKVIRTFVRGREVFRDGTLTDKNAGDFVPARAGV